MLNIEAKEQRAEMPSLFELSRVVKEEDEIKVEDWKIEN